MQPFLFSEISSMINPILIDGKNRASLYPLTYTRPISEIRVGIWTIKEKWSKHLNVPVQSQSTPLIDALYATDNAPLANLFIQGGVLPNAELVSAITSLSEGQSLIFEGDQIAVRSDQWEGQFDQKTYEGPLNRIQRPYDVFTLNGEELKADYELITKGRTSEVANSTNTIINKDQVFIEPGAQVQAAILNASNGPIYIGRDAEIMEGSVVRGPFAMNEHSKLKLSTKVYGPCSLGPHVKVGGEISDCVFLGYANKAHDGYLGNSVIGEWCNLGADTNSSNLKNNYSEVKIWDYQQGKFAPTGLQFCGLIMGDHSKSGINTMFNTGTVVGIHANIYGGGFPRTLIPSFAWGGSVGMQTYRFDKAMEVAEIVMARRNIQLTEAHKLVYKEIFERTSDFRSWE